MFKSYLLLLCLLVLLPLDAASENTTCKKCHPAIFAEYQRSMHHNASIFRDPIHRAVWEKHPAKAANNYSCAKCHTPSNQAPVSGSRKLSGMQTEQQAPVSCQTCHTITDVEHGEKSNTNHYSHKPKYFFSADKSRKGETLTFKEEKHFFGLVTHTSGSPFHTIDYSNEIYYNAKMCLGCHDHKQNGKGFAICDMQIKQGESKESCISCHMPQKRGSFVNLHDTKTHAFHGMSIHTKPLDLSSHVILSLAKKEKGFDITIHNKATHALFPHPLRLNQLRVSIERGGEILPLPAHSFVRIIGKEGKPAMPWEADSVLKDTLIKALEKRTIHYDTALQQGDSVILEFGYYLVNPKAAGKLGIKGSKATEFTVLTKRRIDL
jgi:hypothetical protein